MLSSLFQSPPYKILILPETIYDCAWINWTEHTSISWWLSILWVLFLFYLYKYKNTGPGSRYFHWHTNNRDTHTHDSHSISLEKGYFLNSISENFYMEEYFLAHFHPCFMYMIHLFYCSTKHQCSLWLSYVSTIKKYERKRKRKYASIIFSFVGDSNPGAKN